MPGFVYVMSNPSFVAGRIKIGKSDRNPINYRKQELETTGVPEPFRIEYYARVSDHHTLERELHRKFDAFRPNKQREFFDVPIPEVIVCIRQSVGVLEEHVFYQSPEEIRRLQRQAEALATAKVAEAQERERVSQRIGALKNEMEALVASASHDLWIREVPSGCSPISLVLGCLSAPLGVMGAVQLLAPLMGSSPWAAFLGPIITFLAAACFILPAMIHHKMREARYSDLLRQQISPTGRLIAATLSDLERACANSKITEREVEFAALHLREKVRSSLGAHT